MGIADCAHSPAASNAQVPRRGRLRYLVFSHCSGRAALHFWIWCWQRDPDAVARARAPPTTQRLSESTSRALTLSLLSLAQLVWRCYWQRGCWESTPYLAPRRVGQFSRRSWPHSSSVCRCRLFIGPCSRISEKNPLHSGLQVCGALLSVTLALSAIHAAAPIWVVIFACTASHRSWSCSLQHFGSSCASPVSRSGALASDGELRPVC